MKSEFHDVLVPVDDPAPLAQVIRWLGDTALFGSLGEDVLELMAGRKTQLQLAKGGVLMREGETGDRLYIVTGGLLEILVGAETPERISTVGPGAVIGELALLGSQRRSATVRALEPTRLLALSSTDLDWLHEESEHADEIAQRLLRAMEHAQIRSALHRSELFAGMSGEVLDDIAQRLEPLRLARGGVLVTAGAESDCAWIVVTGRLSVEDASGRRLTVLGHGELIGEMGILTGEVRNATVRAIRDSLVAEIRPDVFWDVVLRNPKDTLHYITTTIVERLQDAGQGGRPGPISLSVVPITTGEPVDDAIDALIDGLSQQGTVLRLSRASLAEQLHRPDAADTRVHDPYHAKLSRWLNEQERFHDYIVFEPDGTDSGWTQRCLRHSDRLLLVAPATQSPDPLPIEAMLAEHSAYADLHRSLVLVHDPTVDLPSGTRHWLACRDIDVHHHVRRDRKADYGRVARHIAGRPIGLALSGGGACALAHIGGIAALRELGVPIDVICGTSMGSCISAQHAMGWDWDTMRERSQEAFHGRFDYTLPVASLTVGRRLRQAMEGLFGDAEVEDLWIPWFCVTSNLSRSRAEVQTSGRVALKVHASSAVPGVVPPVPIGADLHVDGAMVNNLPVDVLKQRFRGVTAMAMTITRSPLPKAPEGTTWPKSGWQLLWERLRGKPSGIPSMLETLMRASLVSSNRAFRDSLRVADLTWQLSPGEFGLLDVHQKAVRDLSTSGRETTRRVFQEWLEQDNEVAQRLVGMEA